LAPKPVVWLDLPHEWLNTIRRSFSEPLGWSFTGPGRISAYSFGGNNWVFYNFNNKTTEIYFKLDTSNITPANLRFKNNVTGRELIPEDDVFHLVLKKRQMLWLTVI